jgi:hypothetical protein
MRKLLASSLCELRMTIRHTGLTRLLTARLIHPSLLTLAEREVAVFVALRLGKLGSRMLVGAHRGTKLTATNAVLLTLFGRQGKSAEGDRFVAHRLTFRGVGQNDLELLRLLRGGVNRVIGGLGNIALADGRHLVLHASLTAANTVLLTLLGSECKFAEVDLLGAIRLTLLWGGESDWEFPHEVKRLGGIALVGGFPVFRRTILTTRSMLPLTVE